MYQILIKLALLVLKICLPMASILHFRDIILNTYSFNTMVKEISRTLAFICEIWGIFTAFQNTNLGLIIYFSGRLLHLLSQFVEHIKK